MKCFRIKNKYGYNYVKLTKNGKSKAFKVHRLVAMAFIPNSNNFCFVNHKNENKRDNRASNLEWCNKKYNCQYGTSQERLSKNRKNSPFVKRIPVVRVSDGKFYNSCAETLNDGFDPCHVAEVCRGIRKTNCGESFRYATELEVKEYGRKYTFVKKFERG